MDLGAGNIFFICFVFIYHNRVALTALSCDFLRYICLAIWTPEMVAHNHAVSIKAGTSF